MDDIARAFMVAQMLFWGLVIGGAVAASAAVALAVVEFHQWWRDRASSGEDETTPG